MADVWHALSHPLRRDVLALLRQGGMSAGEIGKRFDCSGATLSGHLRALLEADLVSVEAEGNHRIYRINLSVAEDALAGLLGLLRYGDEQPNRQEEPS